MDLTLDFPAFGLSVKRKNCSHSVKYNDQCPVKSLPEIIEPMGLQKSSNPRPRPKCLHLHGKIRKLQLNPKTEKCQTGQDLIATKSANTFHAIPNGESRLLLNFSNRITVRLSTGVLLKQKRLASCSKE
jgi:hypothetical protein